MAAVGGGGDGGGTHYDTLGVAPGASAEAVRRAYHAACLAYHPDKQSASLSAAARAAATAELARAQAAWAVLGDADARARYDDGIRLVRGRVVTDVLGVEELHRFVDEGEAWRALECRCGGRFSVAEADLSAGVDTVPCDTCSLAIRVVP
jgi:diphthamide biosynthesis protein 4